MSLPHDLSGSRSKNRFRIELLWGVTKFLELMETSENFTMIFDYVCDIEIIFDNYLEFYQIKTRSNNPYSTTQLVRKTGEGSILGKLYVLLKDDQELVHKVAIVSNARYTACDNSYTETCFDKLSDKEKTKIVNALKTEIGVDSIDLSRVFYIQTGMDLSSPNDAVRGKLIQTFERIKKCEPSNPNALYRLITDSVSSKACCEYVEEEYDELVDAKGMTRQEFDELLDLHTEESKTGLPGVRKYINDLENVRDKMIYNKSLPNVIKYMATSKLSKKIEEDIVKYLLRHDVGNLEEAIDILINEFDDRFSIEVSKAERTLFYVIIISRFEDGVYEYEYED